MVKYLHDYRTQPRELFDGFEPTSFLFDPASFGQSDYESVDLVAACSERPELTLPMELQRELQLLAAPRVRVFNKSSSRQESLLGYYAISRSSSRSELLVILFSFFEVSPMRFHAYLHALLTVNRDQ